MSQRDDLAPDHHPFAGANALPPALMTAEQRLYEVAAIMDRGLLRLRNKEKSHNDLRDFRLDFPPGRSVHATPRKRRKAAR